ncbi:MAG: acetyl-CoA decarbonylase/synthase complex subunit gamma [Candidatus Auribacterota bacterium]|nr:acetyl-CoA decarbonylase/synthase complex subunit gamma [Candidatus Auribacterota bacterium]
MALTGLDIYKLLPKTNCKDCGFPTCLAFAMKLAAKQASLDQCPHVSEEAQRELGSASRPPINLVEIGTGEKKIALGNETVLFRHEETFYHETALAILVREDEEELEEKITRINKLEFERVGQEIGVNLLALKDTSGDPERYSLFVEKCAQATGLGLILISDSFSGLEAALEKVGERRPLIYSAHSGNLEKMCGLAKKYSSPLVIRGEGLEETARVAEKAGELGIEDLLLDTSPDNFLTEVTNQIIIRRQALNKQFRPFGYPTIAFTSKGADKMTQALETAVLIAKYAGIIVTELLEPEYILPLLTTRQNIYTDPQKPIQVEPKLYEVGSPDRSSPLIITTNFSLTYFTVEGEIEASRIPAYLLIVDTEGTSVLTAWAADKFNAESISEAMIKAGVEEMLDHKKVILPGYVAVLSGKLEDESGWEVLVGPKEASGIPKFLKTLQ